MGEAEREEMRPKYWAEVVRKRVLRAATVVKDFILAVVVWVGMWKLLSVKMIVVGELT